MARPVSQAPKRSPSKGINKENSGKTKAEQELEATLGKLKNLTKKK